jgi:glucose-1-phosphate adenylyltransferase
MEKEVVAMLLAGGRGTRLGLLTDDIAKPAVPFGGKYRIIDFTLSNCANSGINTIGVLTQYRPMTLNSYIGIGSSWDLDKTMDENGDGVTILPPYINKDGGQWYSGTANSIFQNIEYIDQHNPKYVLILSGDHIYRMNYQGLIDHHKEMQADATISVLRVPWEEANRFGIMNTDEDGKIVEFQEKPEKPKNNQASMGIYVFDWKVLREQLIEDEKKEDSSHDFGKDIIPQLLGKNKKLYAYNFSGYWKDVGTVNSYWEADMDLLSKDFILDLFDRKWVFRSENYKVAPKYVGEHAEIHRALISDGCKILGEVDTTVIFPEVFVGEQTRIIESVIMPKVRIGENVLIEKTIIGEGTIIEDGVKLLKDPKDEITVIPHQSRIVLSEDSPKGYEIRRRGDA